MATVLDSVIEALGHASAILTFIFEPSSPYLHTVLACLFCAIAWIYVGYLPYKLQPITRISSLLGLPLPSNWINEPGWLFAAFVGFGAQFCWILVTLQEPDLTVTPKDGNRHDRKEMSASVKIMTTWFVVVTIVEGGTFILGTMMGFLIGWHEGVSRRKEHEKGVKDD